MKAIQLLMLVALLPFADVSARNASLKPEESTGSPLEPYLKKDKFGTIRISPTGEYLAVTLPLNDRTSLAILRRSDMKMTGHVTFEKNVHVSGFMWVNPTRVLFSVGKKFGELESPQGTGEIFGVNADGTGQGTALIGGWFGAYIVDDLREDDDAVLVQVNGEGGINEVDRMNVKTGSRTTVCRAPVRNATFVTDLDGKVRFAIGTDAGSITSKTYYRANEKVDWELINDEAITHVTVSPAGFSADRKLTYLQVEEASGTDGIYSFDNATKERKLLYRDANSDPVEFLSSPVDDSLYGVGFGDGVPHIEYIDSANPFAQLQKSLEASFPGQVVLPLSSTKDANLGLYFVYSDRIPGDFYLFDRATKKMTYVASRNSWFKPEMLNPMRVVSLKARDGTDLHGFLTVPKGSDGKNLPLVINPHGGPFGVKDDWQYNPEVQMLADHGYAVLQINYRGSSGYGRAFLRSGYKQWGGTMQDDLTDATRWAVSQGIANARRICIYGASYGGYAALMGVTKEPDLYRCAIGYVGVYNLASLQHEEGVRHSMATQKWLKEAVGDQDLAKISPNLLADRIKVPVMLAAGDEDQTAPKEHTEKMRNALASLGKPVEMTIYENEGHGNYLMKNKVDFYTKLLAFLDRNIGAATAAGAASANK